MPRLRLGLTNIYLKVGLSLVVIALACLALLFAFWPVADSVEVILLGMARVGFPAGVVLYVIGKIAQARRSRAQA
jgi:hypothetical protein